jgi:hypothetical protein
MPEITRNSMTRIGTTLHRVFSTSRDAFALQTPHQLDEKTSKTTRARIDHTSLTDTAMRAFARVRAITIACVQPTFRGATRA